MFQGYLHTALFISLAIATQVVEAESGVVQVSERIWSGPRPLSCDFKRFHELGVRTMISVDGARPDIEGARAAGLRYVHIPIGYDGIPDDAAAALAKTLAEREGPFYIHCHHGKHRGPAMAALALRLEEAADATAARKVMKEAGTSPDYTGLWHDVENFDPASIEDKDPELHEVAPVGRMTEAMAALDTNWDHLLMLQENDWQLLERHPDLVAVEEAKQMLETFQALLRTGRYERDFGTMLVNAVDAAKALHTALAEKDSPAIAAAMKSNKAACTVCHKQYRNVAQR